MALDFGRISLDEGLRLYLFGTPGQDRYAFLWDDLVARRARRRRPGRHPRIEDCFTSIDYFEEHGVPFLVAVNQFPDDSAFEPRRGARGARLAADIPMVRCDARNRDSVKGVLVALVEELIARRLAEAAEPMARL